MKNIQIIRRKSPLHVSQPADRFGCVGFTSYGVIVMDHTVVHIKNPDFDWSLSKSEAALVVANANQ